MTYHGASPRRLAGCVLRLAAVLAMLAACARVASAQEIEPNDFVPAPPGTNAVLGYYIYGHNQGYNVARGPTIQKSALEVNLGLARYVHFTQIAGLAAGYQIFETFGSEASGHIGEGPGTGLGSTFGAGNPTLSAFIWPYSSTEKKQYLILAGFLYPPVGSYNKNNALNVGSPNWQGEAQLGWDQGIGQHFSYDIGADIRAFGDSTGPSAAGSVKTSQNPNFRLQAYANWNWTAQLQTSIGWESILGGTVNETIPGLGRVATGAKSEFERLRVAASYFVLPNTQLLLELNHDFVAVGGFKQTFGATARVLYLF